MWEILDTGISSAERNMAIDAQLLDTLETRQRPILHFYEWERESATYGHFVDPGLHLNLEGAKSRGLALARRPTGGGIVFHLWDLAFSVLIPAHSPHFSRNTLENYAFVNARVLAAVRAFLETKSELKMIPVDGMAFDPECQRFCMAKPTKYDVVLEGRKIAGAAQRQRKEGFLHQGTIALSMPDEDYLNDVLAPGTRVREAMQKHTYSLLGSKTTEEEKRHAKEKLRILLQTHLTS